MHGVTAVFVFLSNALSYCQLLMLPSRKDNLVSPISNSLSVKWGYNFISWRSVAEQREQKNKDNRRTQSSNFKRNCGTGAMNGLFCLIWFDPSQAFSEWQKGFFFKKLERIRDMRDKTTTTESGKLESSK